MVKAGCYIPLKTRKALENQGLLYNDFDLVANTVVPVDKNKNLVQRDGLRKTVAGVVII